MAALFLPVRLIDGYVPIEDHGLIGDGTTAALVGRDGAIDWMCVPRFDSPPLFCRILDANRGGAFVVAPEDLVESRQFYEADSAVLVTELRGRSSLVRVTDALTLHFGADLIEAAAAGRHELLRTVEVLHGRPRLRLEVEPRGGVRAEPHGGGFSLRCDACPDIDLWLFSSVPLDGLRTTRDFQAGDRLNLILRWGSAPHRYQDTVPDERGHVTITAWQRWLRCFQYEGPQVPLVRRSAVTLKLLNYTQTGAIVAAPTSSLPEAIGGVRNWDYRYAWICDAAFSVYALRRIGVVHEAASFLGWVLDAAERTGRPRVLYDVDGHRTPPEREDPELEGYRRSRPVRWGNAAAEQRQHDVYGEILDCAYQWAARGGEIDGTLWARLQRLVEAARAEWRSPDHGIWEVRTAGRVFTYSAAMCQVALDRRARLVENHRLPGDVEGWRAEAERIRVPVLSWETSRRGSARWA